MIAPLLAAVLLAPQTPAPATEAEFLDWARDTALSLDSLDWRQDGLADFSFLDEALEGKRIVYLGETDHFVAERMEFRLVLIRELMMRGYRRIGMEMGLSDGKRMDRYLETGDEAWLDRVALYGYRGDLRQDRDDLVPGWTDDSHSAFMQVVLDEAKWFLRDLRAMNEMLGPGEARLRWFGYDLSFRPGGGYADARELLARHQGSALAGRILAGMARVPGESRIEEAERLEEVVALLDRSREELLALLGESGVLELRRSLQRMADAFRFIDGLPGIQDYDAAQVAAALSARERRMAHNFDEHLAEWPPDEKIILLGHALHLSQDSERIQASGYGAMWESIGTSLARKLPGQVYGVWLLHLRGRHGLPLGEPAVQPFHSPPGAIEGLLARVGPRFLLPLGSGDPREAWLDQERSFLANGVGRAVLPRQLNCLFFVEVASEPRRRDEESAAGD